MTQMIGMIFHHFEDAEPLYCRCLRDVSPRDRSSICGQIARKRGCDCRDPEKETREVVFCSVRQQKFVRPFGLKSLQGVEGVAGLPGSPSGVNRTPRADAFQRSEGVVLELVK